MYFQLGRVQTYMDFRVWCNHNSILTTPVNPVTAPSNNCKPGNSAMQWRRETTGLNALLKLYVACSQRLTYNKKIK